jgi:hypothetical protein
MDQTFYVGEVGRAISIFCGFDISTVASKSVTVYRPNSSHFTQTSTEVTVDDATTGQIHILTRSGDLSLSGTYTVQAKMTLASGSILFSPILSFEVDSVYDEEYTAPTTGSYAAGDLLYASSITSLSRLPIGTSNQYLGISSGLAPMWLDGFINIRSYGAVGDGIADDTNAIQDAITEAEGKLIYLPPGIYKISSGLTHSGALNMFGVSGKSIIRPADGTGIALTVTNGLNELGYGSASFLGGFSIDGQNDPTGNGLKLGTSETLATNLTFRQVDVNSYSESGGVGWLIGDATGVEFYGCASVANETGAKLYSTTHGTPTDISWMGGRIMFNLGSGWDIQEGRGILIGGGAEIESNHGRGVYIHPPASGQCRRIVLENAWIENNQATGEAGDAEIEIDGTASSAVTDIIIKNVYNSIPSTNPDAIFLKSNGATSLRLEDPYLQSGAADNLVIGGASTRIVVNDWTTAVNGTVTDAFDFFNSATLVGNVTVHESTAGGYGITGYLAINDELYINNSKVLGARGAAVADAAGGATVDTEARAAINTLLARMRAHGSIAT